MAIARCRTFTTTTRILQLLVFLCKLGLLCFLASAGVTNLNTRAKTKWILVVVVKSRHRENDLLMSVRPWKWVSSIVVSCACDEISDHCDAISRVFQVFLEKPQDYFFFFRMTEQDEYDTILKAGKSRWQKDKSFLSHTTQTFFRHTLNSIADIFLWFRRSIPWVPEVFRTTGSFVSRAKDTSGEAARKKTLWRRAPWFIVLDGRWRCLLSFNQSRGRETVKNDAV